MPEYFGDDPPPKKSLEVIAEEEFQDWWQDELDQYAPARVTSKFQTPAADPWESEKQLANSIRVSLGIPQLSNDSTEERQYLLIDADSPRAQHWGKLQAMWFSKETGIATVAVDELPQDTEAKRILTDIVPETALKADTLPRCPGPFGGTTVVVLPKEVKQDQVDRWLTVEKSDPLAAASRFHRVRIATSSGERALPKVLEKLKSENRNNVLIVPAVFYADLSWLRELHNTVRQFEDQTTLQWHPGLGGQESVLDE